jgi:hypothetical protein
MRPMAGGALPPDDAGDAFARSARHKLKALRAFPREAEKIKT